MGNVVSVLAAFIAIVVVFSLTASSLMGRRERANTVGTGETIPRQTLFVLVPPILSIFWCGLFYKDPRVPWLDMLGIALAGTGYTALFVLWIVRAPFTLLGLYRRSSKWIAAIAFMAGGAVLVSRDMIHLLSGR